MMIWTDDYEALDPALAAQRRTFRDEIKELLRERHADFPRWIVPPLGINFDERLFRLLRHTGRTGPMAAHSARGQRTAQQATQTRD